METKIQTVTKTTNENVTQTKVEKVTAVIECQYQIVQRDKVKKTTETNIEELFKRIQPAKSFLYRNNAKKTERVTTSYEPMNVGQKRKKLFRLSYDYPSFDLSRFRMSKTENFNDRGYYQVKNESEEKSQHNFYSSAQDVFEDHLYEDLNYNEVKDRRRSSVTHVGSFSRVKFQGIFNTFRKPFTKKEVRPEKTEAVEMDVPIYENGDSVNSLYDTVKVRHTCDCNKNNGQPQVLVEEYLEPIQQKKESDYCDVSDRQRGETFLGFLLSILGMRKETNDTDDTEEETKPNPETTRWTEDKAVNADDKMADRSNMADRPLPVPVDKEPYYMHVDRGQAEELLMGQPDGAFILRPSSQPAHVYTLSVACASAVHNVGLRRRPDGRLALGFARKGERSFATIPSLIRHHRRRRLLLVSGGGVLGAVTLTEPPLYYHTPSNIPVARGCQGVCLADKVAS